MYHVPINGSDARYVRMLIIPEKVTIHRCSGFSNSCLRKYNGLNQGYIKIPLQGTRNNFLQRVGIAENLVALNGF